MEFGTAWGPWPYNPQSDNPHPAARIREWFMKPATCFQGAGPWNMKFSPLSFRLSGFDLIHFLSHSNCCTRKTTNSWLMSSANLTLPFEAALSTVPWLNDLPGSRYPAGMKQTQARGMRGWKNIDIAIRPEDNWSANWSAYLPRTLLQQHAAAISNNSSQVWSSNGLVVRGIKSTGSGAWCMYECMLFCLLLHLSPSHQIQWRLESETAIQDLLRSLSKCLNSQHLSNDQTWLGAPLRNQSSLNQLELTRICILPTGLMPEK